MSTTISIQSNDPTLETVRPIVPIADPNTLQYGDYYAWLAAQGDRYRGSSIVVDAASRVSHRWEEPFIAGRNMCVPPAVDGGYNAPSPNALIRDPWHDLVVTAAATQAFTTASPTHTLAVSALDRAIPAGFVLGFPGAGYLEVAADAPRDATSISLARIWADVTVTSGQAAAANNGFYYQQGTPSPFVSNMSLIGDAEPMVRNWNWTGRAYACDGVAVSGMGAQFDNLLIDNFPGHGLWVSNPTAFSTLTGLALPWDRPECGMGHVSVSNCYAGITVLATDTAFDRLVAAGCRDYGVRFVSSATQGGTIHAYGCPGTGIWLSLGGYVHHLEGENCGFGIMLDAASQIGAARVFGNIYCGLRVIGGEVHLGSVWAEHSSSSTIGGDPFTGYAVSLGSWADNFICPAFRVFASNGANGLRLGHSTLKALEGVQIAGKVTVSAGTCAKGVDVLYSLNGSVIDLAVGGFTTDVYFETGVVLTGNQLTFRGASSATVRWADGTTGTFGTPNVPSAVSAANTVAFHTY